MYIIHTQNERRLKTKQREERRREGKKKRREEKRRKKKGNGKFIELRDR